MGNRTWRQRLNSIAPENVDIELQNGRVLDDVRAYFVSDPDEIIIPRKFCPDSFDVGDIIVRKASPRRDRLMIVETGYKPEFNPEMSNGYIEHFAVQWKRDAGNERDSSVATHVTYNLHGPNTRVNNNSSDFSANESQADPWADQRPKLKLLLAEVQQIQNTAQQIFIPDEEIEVRVSTIDFDLAVFEAALLDTFNLIAHEAALVNNINWLRQTCKTVNNKLRQYLHDRLTAMTLDQLRTLTRNQNYLSRQFRNQIDDYCKMVLRSLEQVINLQG